MSLFEIPPFKVSISLKTPTTLLHLILPLLDINNVPSPSSTSPSSSRPIYHTLPLHLKSPLSILSLLPTPDNDVQVGKVKEAKDELGEK